jgi:hypothetical protein
MAQAKNHDGLESYSQIDIQKLAPGLSTGCPSFIRKKKSNSARLLDSKVQFFDLPKSKLELTLFFGIPENLPWEEPALVFETILRCDFWPTEGF